jgi:hypothetical protein
LKNDPPPSKVEGAAIKDDVDVAVTRPEGKVVFVPSQHSTGVMTPSGAVFTFSPQVAVKVSRTDAEDLAAAGLGTIQGD